MNLFRPKKKEEVKKDLQNFFFVKGNLWTDMPFDVTLLNPEGISIHVEGNVYLGAEENQAPEDGIWIPAERLPKKIKDVIAYSVIFDEVKKMGINI